MFQAFPGGFPEISHLRQGRVRATPDAQLHSGFVQLFLRPRGPLQMGPPGAPVR